MDRRLTRAILCENLQENAGPQDEPRMDISQAKLYAGILTEKDGAQGRDNTATHTLCELRSENAHGHGHLREAVYAKVFKENAPDQDPDHHFMRACAVEMHMAICEEAVYARMFNAPDQDRDNRFVRVCAVDMQMDISQKQFYARIYGKKVGKSWKI